EEIQAIEDKYAAAALRAQKAGFDGVEVHATGYYLVAQFFSATANHRTDEYGGNAFNRARFAVNIAQKIKATVGENFPVFYKLSVLEIGDYGGVKLRDGLLNCYMLQQAGVAAIEVLAGAWSTRPKKRDKPDSGQASGLTFPIVRLMKCAKITRHSKRPGLIFGKKALTIPLIAGGRTFDPKLAEKALTKGWGDFIFMGRGLLTQPDLPRMIAAGIYDAARPCIGCDKCMDGQLQRDERIACSGNAVIGVGANDYTIPPASIKKRVYVIGGGPAGVEAARIAAIRGHEVILFEKDARLGGQLQVAVAPPHKQNLRLLLKYLEEQVVLTGVKVRLNTEMTAALILDERPDVVICATGVRPAGLRVPGFEKPLVMNAKQALDGAKTGRRVIIIGGGVIGCEAAELLAEKGKQVAVVDVLDKLAVKMAATSRTILLAHLDSLGVKIYGSSKCKEIKDHSVVIEHKSGGIEELKADTVLIAVGDRPNRDLYSELEGKIMELYAVGDCHEPASIVEAVSTGYYTALQL
ncbi:MAG TPA: FAD-dependent oxidoreductase, partial [Bacillota bacterium]|nr:FAD-dependent oxidoreductase [Bacillota bacterium]